MDIDISVDKHGFRLKGIRLGQKQFFAQTQPKPFWQNRRGRSQTMLQS